MKILECKICGTEVNVRGENAVSITCWQCVQEMADPPKIKVLKKSNKPRGWQFMKEFVDTDGRVYHRGVEQPELKGTLSPTKVKPVERKKRLSKLQKETIKNTAVLKIWDLKRKLEETKFKKDKVVLQRKIKNLEKIVNGKIPNNYKSILHG